MSTPESNRNSETKKYKILSSLPVYGPMYISVAERDETFYSEGFPVCFYKSDGTDWVANFKPGWTELKEVHELVSSENLLIIAGGTCYIMHPEKTKPISVFGVDFVKVFKTQDERFVLQGSIDLTVVETTGEHWHSERISWDELKDLKLEDYLVTGFSYDPMNDINELVEFTYNIETKTLIGGSYKRYELREMGKNSWWKIWQ